MNPDDPLGLITPQKHDASDPLGLITPHNKPKIGQMGRAITTEEDAAPYAGSKVLGVLAALNRDIPGAEAAQAGVRSVVRGQSYRDARSDIRGAEDAAPWQATLPSRLLGAGIAAAAIPGGPILQGARFGALSGLGQSDPDLSVGDRIRSGGEGAAVGAATGAILPAAKALGGYAKTAKDVLGILHGNPASAVRLGTRAAPAIRQFIQTASRAAPEVASEAVPAAESVASPAARSVAEAVKAARQSHRTIAQFQNFAERMGADPPQPQTLGGQLHGLLNRLRTSQPLETGNVSGDAEEAMGLAPHQQPDLESLLRQSLKLKPRTLGGEASR